MDSRDVYFFARRKQIVDMDCFDIITNGLDFVDEILFGLAIVDDEFDAWGARENIEDSGEEVGVCEETNGLGFVEGVF